MAPDDQNFVDQLRAKLAVEWTAILEARRRAEQAREKVSKSLTEMNFVSGDTSVVVFGSLARDEFTDESDLDWTLLVDGQADSDHLHTAQAIRKKLTLAGFKEPGRTGVFGNTTFSHGLIHLSVARTIQIEIRPREFSFFSNRGVSTAARRTLMLGF